jgi:dynein intermediate chain 4, axonemal
MICLFINRTASGVTSLDFSARHPSLLAVGMYSGAIAIYDTARGYAQPIAESSTSSGKHTDPVWQVSIEVV